MSLEHTLMERPDVASFLATSEPPPMSEELREATADLARELASAWSHGALPPGVELGKYRIEEPLGHGGQASVYRARDAEGRSYAIKVPRQELLQRLIREAQILFHLDHPRVVRIISADVKSSPPYLVTEHLTGGTLAEVLERTAEGRLPLERVRELGIAVLEALAYAHEKGVIHRDLKPSNILFDAGGEAKVADFGIGSLSLDTRLEGTLVSHDRTGVAGTPLYMAPEQELGAAEVDARADLYALGKVIYRALTGLSPRTIRPLRRALPELDVAWEDFILTLVEDEPEHRYASAEEARVALAGLPGEQGPPLEGPHLVLPAPPRAPADEELISDPGARAPWATGHVVDQVLVVAQRLSAAGQGGLFAFVPQPWEPSPNLRGVRSCERSLAELEDLLALEPLGVALRGRSIRATFEPQGTDSRRAWLEAALAEQLQDPISANASLGELFLVNEAGDLVARARREGQGASDWVVAAKAARVASPPGWISLPVGSDLLLAPVPDLDPRDRQRALERLSWLARRVSALGPEGWRRASPGLQFDTTVRNRIAAELARDGALVLHVEPSGRSLVYSGQGVQATRSVSYLRRLLEGGLGLLAPGVEPVQLPAPVAKRSHLPWLVPLAVFAAGILGLFLISPALNTIDFSLGALACVGAAFSARTLANREAPLWQRYLNFFVTLLVIGIAVGLLEAALR